MRRGGWIAVAAAVLAGVVLTACVLMPARTDRQTAELGALCAEGERGPVVVAVMPDSEADRAGIMPGDVLLTLDGEPVAAGEACFARPDAGSCIAYERNGQVLRHTVGR